MVHFDRTRPWSHLSAAEGVAAVIGIGLLALAWMMNDQWLITHFPPDYFPPYGWIERTVGAGRVVLVAGSFSLVFVVRGRAGLLLQRSMAGKWILPAAGTILAIVLALAAAEIILRSSGWKSVNSWDMRREPLRRHDPVLGWTLVPSHTGYLVTGGRKIEYANNAFSYRAPRQDIEPDFHRPTILLAGESVLGGFGLHWDESPTALLGKLEKVQTVDLSVGGYATDQIYLRLKGELARFERPVAVVILFSPMLFRRNVEDGRPHLGPDLVLRPSAQGSRLVEMARWAVPYRGVDETDRAIFTTRLILSAAVRLAKSRGAVPIVLVPQYLPENPAERLIRSRVLGNIDLPTLWVPLDSRWRLPGDWHPDARAARAIALAISNRLQSLAGDKAGRSASAAAEHTLISPSQ